MNLWTIRQAAKDFCSGKSLAKDHTLTLRADSKGHSTSQVLMDASGTQHNLNSSDFS